MTRLSKLTFGAILILAGSYIHSAPPRVSGNRPVVIDAPIPDADEEPARIPPRRLAAVEPDVKALPAAEPGAARSPADELIRARDEILKCSTIQAKIVETVAIYDRRYKAEGRYLQRGLKPNDWHMRLELALKVGESAGSLLEVCDGDVLWTSTLVDAGRKPGRKEKKDQSLVRRNVTQILEAARKHGDQAESRVIAELGLGGIPGLLAAMQQEMKFTSMTEETLNGRPVVVIQGTWTDVFASRLMMQNPQQQPKSSLLPPFVPDAVRISIDRETGFPHRFVYLKKIPDRDVLRPMLTFDFLDVALNQPIDNSEFAYEPPSGLQPVELTKFYLDRLNSATAAPQAPGQPQP
jgi:outer membrane lipoprotein-sorting protein